MQVKFEIIDANFAKLTPVDVDRCCRSTRLYRFKFQKTTLRIVDIFYGYYFS